ncbi:hypothetical protein JCM11491_001043 [Sporobolomyces phaffii]
MSNLLPLPFKRTLPVELGAALISHVAVHSSTTHPDEVTVDAQRLDAARKDIYGTDGTPLVLVGTVDRLSTYQAQLTLALEKFPDNAGPPFSDYPLFSPSSSLSSLSSPLPGSISELPSSSIQPPSTVHSLTYELCTALYNLASLYTHLAISHRSSSASSSSSHDADSLKTSLNYFQLSLGTLDKLVLLSSSSTSPSAMKDDSDFDERVMLGWKEYVCAMAQEVGWQKSVVDRLKNGTISKLAVQVAKYYERALSLFPPQDEYLPAEWTRYFQLKRNHFEAVAHYRRSLDDLGANRYGDEIGRLTLSAHLVKSVLDSVPRAPRGRGGGPGTVLDLVVRDLKTFSKVLQDSLARANKDNDLIYLAQPTPLDSLAAITPFPLARSTPPPLVAKPFENLAARDRVFVGMETKEIGYVLGLWDDRKTTWLRDDVEREWEQRLDGELRGTLKELGLPGSLERRRMHQEEEEEAKSTTDTNEEVEPPRHLIEVAEEVVRLGGTKRLERLFEDVRKVSLVNEQLLTEANTHLASTSTSTPTPAPTAGPARGEDEAFAQSLRERSTHFRALLDQAQTSDLTVRQKYSQHAHRIEILSNENALSSTLAAALPPPPPQQPAKQTRTGTRRDPTVEVELTRLERKLKAAVDELKDAQEERTELARRIKLVVDRSDIRHVVVLRSDEIANERQGGGSRGEGAEGAWSIRGNEEGGLEDYEEVLRREMARMQSAFRQDMDLNEKKQHDLLDQLKTFNSTYLSLVKEHATETAPSSLAELQASVSPSPPSARHEAIESFLLAHAKYLEILQNLEEGLKFYADLSRLSSELRDQTKEDVGDVERSINEEIHDDNPEKVQPAGRRSNFRPGFPDDNGSKDTSFDGDSETKATAANHWGGATTALRSQ